MKDIGIALGVLLLVGLGVFWSVLHKDLPHKVIVAEEGSPGGRWIASHFTSEIPVGDRPKLTRIAIRRAGEKLGSKHSHVFFSADGQGNVRVRWESDNKLTVHYEHMRVLQKEPSWKGVTFVYEED